MTRSNDSRRILEELRAMDGEGLEPRVIVRLRAIEPHAFEELVMAVFAERYRVQENWKKTHDGGVDGRAFDADGRLFLVQCKRVRGYISPGDVKRLAAIVGAAEAAGGLFLHTGKTGPASRRAAWAGRVIIVSGSKLVRFVLDGTLDLSAFYRATQEIRK